MGMKVEYVDSSHVYVTNYVRNSKAVGVLWGLFTICYAIIIVVAFVTPEWIGDTSNSENPGRFGLWARCYFRGSNELSGIGLEECSGQLDDFGSIVTIAFKAATILVGLSVIIALLTICAMLLFFFFASTTTFLVCGWMQLFSGMNNFNLNPSSFTNATSRRRIEEDIAPSNKPQSNRLHRLAQQTLSHDGYARKTNKVAFISSASQ